jgi:hypothetical protein
MNRELYDAQVGTTTECTYEGLHDAVDSILDEPTKELVP